MRFTKMNGAGNDFIIVENLRGELDEQKLSKLARTLCDRRMSIGADGLMAVVPAKGTADYGMLFFNCDGTLGEMCGNGARCFALFAEHRGIAERMYKAYPEVFSTADGRECRIESRSTLVPRCILSMAAFNERLKELNPAIRTTRESSARYMPYMGNNKGLDAQRDRTLKTADSVRAARLIPDRLMKSLFSDPEFVKREVKKPRKLMEQLLLQAAIMQDVDYLGISLYDLFTGEEIYAAWEDENFRRYVMFGPSKRFGDPIIADAKPLLRNIVETAEEVIGGGKELAASLRFGHDVNVIPLLALLGVEGASARVSTPEEAAEVWQVHRVSPMAANVQFIFFRNPAGDVLVRILHNERDAGLPLGGGPYYRWETFRDYCKSLYE